MTTIGPYRVIGASAESSGAPTRLILDTNVAIDIERFYFGDGRFDADGLRELLATFPQSTGRARAIDVQYGWAVAEATWVRGEGHDLLRRRRMVHALGNVLDWDRATIDQKFAGRRAPVNSDKRWPQRVSIDSRADVADPRLFVMLPYGQLLKLLSIERRRDERRSRGPAWALREWETWVRDSLGSRSSYSLTMAVDLLCGSPDRKRSVRRMLKLGGDESTDALAFRAWNAAWDVWFTSLGEGYTYGLLPGPDAEATALVTANVDPYYLRLANEVAAVIDMGRGGNIPMTNSAYELAVGIDEAEVREIVSMESDVALGRHRRDPEFLTRQAAAAVDALETELGVSRRLSFDGWNLSTSGG